MKQQGSRPYRAPWLPQLPHKQEASHLHDSSQFYLSVSKLTGPQQGRSRTLMTASEDDGNIIAESYRKSPVLEYFANLCKQKLIYGSILVLPTHFPRNSTHECKHLAFPHRHVKSGLQSRHAQGSPAKAEDPGGLPGQLTPAPRPDKGRAASLGEPHFREGECSSCEPSQRPGPRP